MQHNFDCHKEKRGEATTTNVNLQLLQFAFYVQGEGQSLNTRHSFAPLPFPPMQSYGRVVYILMRTTQPPFGEAESRYGETRSDRFSYTIIP